MCLSYWLKRKNKLDEAEKSELRKLIIESVQNATGCCAERCTERCGLTPVQHAEHHSEIGEFFKGLNEAKKSAVSVAIKGIVGAVGLLIIYGLYYLSRRQM